METKPRFQISCDAHHIYTVDGRIVPGVTSILKQLKTWDGYPEGAAERGTHVHTIIQWYEDGTLDMESVDPAYQGYLTAWIAFRQQNPLNIDWDTAVWEIKVASKKYGYAGRVDIAPESWIIDIKTGAQEATYCHQLHAYNEAIVETYGGKRRQMAIVYLGADEKHRVQVCKWSALTWNQFQAALTVHNFKFGGKVA